MIISTRGRYALRVMLDLAERQDEGYIAMKDVAEREGFSLGYVARIMAELSHAGLVEGVQGKGGGYRLCYPPENYTVGQIFRATDESFAPVSCVESDTPCHRADACRTFPMWQGAFELLNRYFDGITLADLMTKETAMRAARNAQEKK